MAKELANGTFKQTPKQPEDLDVQKDFRYGFDFYLDHVYRENKGYSKDLIMSTWDHDVFHSR